MTLLINGQWLQGKGPELIKNDPVSGQRIWQNNTAQQDDVAAACQAAASAFPAWSRRSFTDRLALVTAFGQLLAENKPQLTELISRETGKPRWEALTEVRSMINKIAISEQSWHQRTGESQQADSSLRHRPHGVMAVFGPYNFPGHLPNGHIVPALLAGNCVVFKPSELTPATAQLTTELWHKAGLPAGVINLVQGGRETGQALLTDPAVNGVLFTGSAATGYHIHRQFAGRPEIMLALEMGGNNALIVDEPQEIDAAVNLTLQSAFISAGQRCTCARRLLVKRGDAGDRFLTRLAEVAARIEPAPWDSTPAPFMGSVISPQAAGHIWQHWQQLTAAGADVLLEMRWPDRASGLISPGIIDITALPEQPDEEVFGPLLNVIRYDDFDQAIAIANRTRYGLSCGLISEQREKFEQLLTDARAGIVNWNKPLTGAASNAPFGGIGASGNHRPGAWYAADYCAWPMASMESAQLRLPEQLSPGLDFSH
ncbi:MULTISPECIES: succinylglutamate-semialdehyde dehydrogenase [Tatumella]|uniref:N-succinylglutamate 5-semialdehyde dehydrogenase n=1 Tax=Tatumella punctata TaxID=399969 RepID=A0ABW1VTM8_9GAMM|nr:MULTISPECIES: succinylglutamate-semialdehyde dehydrogenase [unclassified Tatumella]MBS0876030.1 succinylglutamate-semialdehyde dehydrogenase [Tatumella sp. JGM82]MBS0890504.1 succinylglutamate-semialdehyde dehydrogenase [Tatumella sp. JGM94]MBS0900960.1 succinylglutamate-semialdehyde dehydrogenase [Tatumella sp. JGM100]